MAQLRSPVQAPVARPPLYGLIAAAPVVNDDNLRWAGGWEFQPEGCGLSGRDSVSCQGDVGVMDPAAGPAILQGDPIWLWAGDECSTFGFQARDWQGRARRQLDATQSYELANELWEGTIAQADSLENRWLAGPGADSDTVTNGPVSLTAALGCVEQGLAELLKGQQGMVHMTPQLLTHLVGGQVAVRSGNVWTTAMGHVIVADAGYTGSGPDSVGPTTTSQWIYGTPMLQVRLGPVELIPGDLADARALAEALDRSVNSIVVLAGRLAGVQWASECAHVAAEVNVGTCLVGGAS